MLNELSDALARHSLTRLAADRPHLRAELDALPPLLAHALRQRLSREAGARLDAAAPWVSDAPADWRRARLESARFPASVWPETVRETASWLVRGLVNPAETFADSLPESGQMATKDVLERMKGLGAYPYLSDVIAHYAETRNRTEFDRETLRDLLERVDRRVAADLDVDGWLTLLSPLYDLVGAIPEMRANVPRSQSDGVPGRVLAEAFAARGMPGLGARVVDLPSVSASRLAEILRDALAPEAASDLSETTESEEAESDSSPDTEEDVVQSEDASDESDAESPTDPEVSPDAASEEDPEDTAEEEATLDVPEPADRQPDEAEPLALEQLVPESETSAAGSVLQQDVAPLPSTAERAEEEVSSPAGLAEPAREIESEPEVAAPEPPPQSPDQPESEPEDEPLWARLARERGAAQAASPPAETNSASQPLWKQFANDSGAAEPSEAPSVPPARPLPSADPTLAELEAYVLSEGAQHRAWYLQHLFGGDGQSYRAALTALAAATTWTEATQVIATDVFRKHRVEIYSDPATSFTDAVEARFR